jgi:hypothetical protein
MTTEELNGLLGSMRCDFNTLAKITDNLSALHEKGMEKLRAAESAENDDDAAERLEEAVICMREASHQCDRISVDYWKGVLGQKKSTLTQLFDTLALVNDAALRMRDIDIKKGQELPNVVYWHMRQAKSHLEIVQSHLTILVRDYRKEDYRKERHGADTK